MTVLTTGTKNALKLAACALAVGLGTLHAQESNSESKAQPEPQPSAEQQRQLPTRVRVSQGVTAKSIIKKVPPEYPKEARKKHVQGTVVLHGVISHEGDVMEISVVSGDPMLTQAAIEAVKQWKYKPYLLNGHPVEVETQFQLNFTLSGN
jgi:protein TonB